MTLPERLWRLRWLRFLLVGGVNTLVSYGVYALLLYLGLPYALANLGSLLFGIAFSFRTHSALVFRQAGRGRFPRFLACWALLYGVHTALIGSLVQLGLDAYLAGAAAVLPMALLSYLVQRQFVFGGRK